jgi:hypothetical protein
MSSNSHHRHDPSIQEFPLASHLSAVVSPDPDHGTRLSVRHGDRVVFELVGALAERVSALLSVEDEALDMIADVCEALPESLSDDQFWQEIVQELCEKIDEDEGEDLPEFQRLDMDRQRDWVLDAVDPARPIPVETDSPEEWRAHYCAVFLAHRALVHTFLDAHDWIFWLLRSSGVSHGRLFAHGFGEGDEETLENEFADLLSPDTDDEESVFDNWEDATYDDPGSPFLVTVAYPRPISDRQDLDLSFDSFMPSSGDVAECADSPAGADDPETSVPRPSTRALVPSRLLSYLVFFDPQMPRHPVLLQYSGLEEGMTICRVDMEDLERTIREDGAEMLIAPVSPATITRISRRPAAFGLARADTLDDKSLPIIRKALSERSPSRLN